jgi:hypothetical protein
VYYREVKTVKTTNRRRLAVSYENLARTRLSKNFILRDFLFSTSSAAAGFSNYPEDPVLVINAGKALCETLLEPILQRFGRFAITFGYQSREGIETDDPTLSPTSSCPHQWDRQSWGHDVYARVDILPFCVEDGEVSKHEFAKWLMHNLDVDLLMHWTRSNVFCLTISPLPRRVWIEWGNPASGEPRQTRFMGADYWQNIYPHLPEAERPKFGPSCTKGSIRWSTT